MVIDYGESCMKVGLVLSGGGTRGVAHLGVLKFLDEHGLKVAAIAGCSVGALFGAFYAYHHSWKMLEDLVYRHDFFSLLDIAVLDPGLVKGKKFEALIAQELNHAHFSDLHIPLFINAVNITTRQETVFSSGPVTPAIRASMSVPGVFTPYEHDGNTYIDGAVYDNIPFKHLPSDIDRVLIVDVGYYTSISTVSIRTINLLFDTMVSMQGAMTQLRLQTLTLPYVLLVPQLQGHFLFESKKYYPALIKKGYACAHEHKQEILKLFS
ncbi:MAG: patatin-like phospholipase family protein [Candidatus Woesearchaeota archaeon]